MMRRHKGFTLIELLIASSVLMIIMLLGTYSYSLFADKWDKQLGHVNQVAQQVRTFTLLDQLLDGIVPLVLYENGHKGFYFDGTSKQLTAISQNGIVRGAEPVVFRLSIKNLNNGKQQVWYEEAGLKHLLILTSKQSIPFDAPLLLIENITQAQFSYFGWENFEIKANASFQNNTTKHGLWFDRYNGQLSQLQPEQLVMELELEQGLVRLVSRYTQNSELLLRDFEGS